MGASATFAALLVLAALGGLTEARGRIAPALEPVSDDKFFRTKGDYPTDTRNNKITPSHNQFKYPFPVIQDSKTYDSDYVKDENADKGYWNVQMTYDNLRAKLAQQTEALEAAQRRAAGLSGRADRANKANRADRADTAGRTDTAGTVDEAEEDVKQAAKDLEKCTSELEAAKKKLAELKAKQEEAHKLEEEKETLEQKTKAAKVDAQSLEKKREEDVKEERAEAAKTQEELDKAKKEYDEAEGELKKAEQALKEFMPKAKKASEPLGASGVPCPKGCVKAGLKSAAPRAGASLSACAVAAILAATR